MIKVHPSVPWHDLKEGEILKAPSGRLRIARVVHRYPNKIWVYFTIANRSWTRRCYTLYTTAELKYQGYIRTGKYKTWWDETDLRIANEMKKSFVPPKMTPEDVSGIG